MSTIKIEGTCSKEEFYKILEYVDGLKQRGFYFLTRRRSDIGESVIFYYSLSNKKNNEKI